MERQLRRIFEAPRVPPPGVDWPTIEDDVEELLEHGLIWLVYKEVSEDYWIEYISPDLRIALVNKVKILQTNGYVVIFGEEDDDQPTLPDSTTPDL